MKKYSLTSLIFVLSLISAILTLGLTWLLEILNISSFPYEKSQWKELIFPALLVAPFLETILAQVIPYHLINRSLTRKYPLIFSLGVGFLFAISHWHVYKLGFLGLIPGSVLVTWLFINSIVERDFSWKKAIVPTTICHFLINVFSTLWLSLGIYP